jgi:hypothetical protein
MKDLGRMLIAIGILDFVLSLFWEDYRQWIYNLVGEIEQGTSFILMGAGSSHFENRRRKFIRPFWR